MSKQRSNFSSFKEINPGTRKVNGIGGTDIFVLGIGTVSIVSHLHGKTKLGEFKDVLYVPKLRTNLFSIWAATDTGIERYCRLSENQSGNHAWPKDRKELYHLKVINLNLHCHNREVAISNLAPTSCPCQQERHSTNVETQCCNWLWPGLQQCSALHLWRMHIR